MKPDRVTDEDGEIVSFESSALITEDYASKLGLTTPSEAVGTVIRQVNRNRDVRFRIIGIVRPVEFNSGYGESQTDLFFLKDPDNWIGRNSKLIARLDSAEISRTLPAIDAVWSRIESDFPIRRWFLDERYEVFYRQSQRLTLMFQTSIGVAVVVSAMGLFGVSAFSAHRRTKEVGVRKANGAATVELLPNCWTGSGVI